VHEGCAFLQCLDGIEDGGQDIVLNLYQLQRLVDSLLVYAGDGGYLVPEKSYLVDAEDILIPARRTDAVLLRRDVLVRDDRLHARNFLRLRRVDAQDPRVGVRARQDLSVEHVWKLQIARVLCLPGGLGPSIYLWNALAYN